MGNIEKKKEQSFGLRFMYGTLPGRLLLKVFSSRALSKIVGCYMDSRLSKPMIKRFVKKNNINLDDFYALLSAYRVDENTRLNIKGSIYSVADLFENPELAEKYQDGICLVFRLCVHHYHRYIYLDNCTKEANHFIKGKLHTVRPIALEAVPVFKRNCREYTVLHTENFGDITQMEVGAMMVGKILNHHQEGEHKRGEEKGMFLYGGSTVVVFIEKDKVEIDPVYFETTERDEETEVVMGQKLGIKKDA